MTKLFSYMFFFKSTFGFLIFLPILIAFPLISQSTEAKFLESMDSQDISLSKLAQDQSGVSEMIRVSFFPKQREYRQGESYAFQVTVENQSLEKVFEFKSYQDPFRQFSFKVKKGYQDYSIKNIDYYRFLYDPKISTSSHKIITLESKEGYSRMVFLGDFFNFDHPGLYEISGEFYPLGVDQSDYRIPIQPFFLRIHPRPSISDPTFLENGGSPRVSFLQEDGKSRGQASLNSVERTSQDKQRNRSISFYPDEVVEDYFKSIQLRDYDSYIRHLELEKLLVNSYRSSEAYLRYQAAQTYEKKIIIGDFKNFLIEKLDYTLVETTVLKTTIIDETAEVETLVSVREPFESYQEKVDPRTGEINPRWLKESVNRLVKFYHLTFDLERIAQTDRSRPWKIIGYEVQVLSADRYQKYLSRLSTSPISSVAPTSSTPLPQDTLEVVLHFEHNQSEVMGEDLMQIKKLAQFLIAYPQLQIEIYGHTDKTGGENYNYLLSKKRVDAVANLLLAAGVDLEKISFYYKGENEPLRFGDSEEDFFLNRRVEIKVRKPVVSNFELD